MANPHDVMDPLYHILEAINRAEEKGRDDEKEMFEETYRHITERRGIESAIEQE